MPGISLYCSYDAITDTKHKQLNDAAELLKTDDRYTTEAIYKNPHIVLFFSSYPQYPRAKWENDDYLIFHEGAVYGKTIEEIQSEISNLYGELKSNELVKKKEILKNWCLENDGEYVFILISKKDSEVLIFTDPLSHLPLFYNQNSKSFAISREQKFLVRVKELYNPDKIGIAQYMVFAFSFGQHTMIDGISRTDPATMIHFDKSEQKTEICNYHNWIFGIEDHNTTNEDFAKNLVDIFQNALEARLKRFPDLHPLLALSGGMDSRAVLASLVKAGVPFSSYTNKNHRQTNLADVNGAKQLVELYNFQWEETSTPPDDLNDMIEIIRRHEGCCSSITSNAIPSFKNLLSKYGADTIFFTGDGGGNVMYPVLPNNNLKTIDDAYSLTALTAYRFKPETVNKLLKMEIDELRESFNMTMKSFPEESINWKYAHYKIFSRALRFIIAGEDRSRFCFWMGTPFWDINIVKLVLKIPDDFKSKFKLYRHFFNNLDKRALEVPYANIGRNLDSPFASLYGSVKSFVKSQKWLYQYARRLRYRQNEQAFSHPKLEEYLSSYISKSEILPEYFDMDILRAINKKSMAPIAYHILATVLLRFEQVEKNDNF